MSTEIPPPETEIPDDRELRDLMAPLPAQPAPGWDRKARLEMKDLTSKEAREEGKEQAWHHIFVWGIRVMAFSLGVVFVVRVINMILPESICWLSAEQNKSINELLFGGTVGTLFGKQLTNVAGLGNLRKPEDPG